jgi:uncharacterized radical SAM protein YgiQ
MPRFLPTTSDEMASHGWKEIDVLLITGDAYFDHPSHGAAAIGRVLENAGYRVGIIDRPNWRSVEDFRALGRPTLFAGITAGAVDSLVNNYTADLAKRRKDVYAPGGVTGGRPDFATLVYTNRVREAFPDLPVVLGGVEASLRRFAYYDPKKDTIRRSVLVDSRADILVYGPGETQVLEIANRLASGNTNLEGILGTARLVRTTGPPVENAVPLPSFQAIQSSVANLPAASSILEMSGRPEFDHPVTQEYEEGVVVAEPRSTPTRAELDRFYTLPFTRNQHPKYHAPIPALETVRWSVVSHRGCPGGCSFCGLAALQGRQVIPRSVDSVLQEIREIAAHPDFKGTITDIGGPTANAYGAVSKNLAACRTCKRASCFYPKICRHIATDHQALMHLLRKAASLAGVKHVMLASGIRHDLALKDPKFIEYVAAHHTGGHLKVAPEHVDPSVLRRMRKPSIALFEQFEQIFKKASLSANKQQYLVPYFIAAFPGCTPSQGDAVGKWLQSRGQRLGQVQTFTALPGTFAAAMQAAAADEKGNRVFIADIKERRRQKSILLGEKNKKKRTNKKR